MRIKREVLERILELCRQAHPREVAGILLGKEEVTDFVLMPGEYFESSVYVRTYNIPIYPDALGTFHSHPGPPVPSQADLRVFSMTGREHLIIGWPYARNTVRAYNPSGNELPVEVV